MATRKVQSYTMRIVQHDLRKYGTSKVARVTLQIRKIDGTVEKVDMSTKTGQNHLNSALETLGEYVEAHL